MRRWTAGLALAGVGILLPVGAAWACLGLAGITTTTASVQPGGTVTVNGVEFGSNPVQIHLDSITGPVLATAVPNSNSGNFTQAVTLPAGVASGQHVLVATEAAATPNGKNNGSSSGTPARTLIQVGSSAPAAASSVARPVNLASASSAGVGSLVLIGLVAAAASLLLAGAVSLGASRRRRPEAEAVKAS
ncbi:MAG: carbohydrate-binding protein [Acidimicrobiales bacterium]